MVRTDRPHLTRVLLSLWLCVSALAGTSAAGGEARGQRVARWGIFEVSLVGPSFGNPFVDVRLSARFEKDGAVFTPEGDKNSEGGACRTSPIGAWTSSCTQHRPGSTVNRCADATCVWQIPMKATRRRLCGQRV